MKKEIITYDIIKVNEQGSKYSGLSFSSPDDAKKFIETYISKKDRESYKIQEYRNHSSYESLDEFVKDNPKAQIQKLKIIMEGKGECIKMPFALALRIKTSSRRLLYANDINNLSFNELSQLLNSAEKDTKSQNIKFSIKNYHNRVFDENCMAFGEISISKFEILKKVFNLAKKDIDPIEQKINQIKMNLDVDENEKE